MEIIYTKIEQLPDISGMRRVFLGIKNNLSKKNNSETNNIYKDYETCMNNVNVSLVSNTYTPIQKNIYLEDPALFLNFIDLDIFSKIHLFSFINQYGYLINNPELVENNFYDELVPVLYDQNFESHKNLGKVYQEPLSIWLLLQNRLSNLVSLWRLLFQFQCNL